MLEERTIPVSVHVVLLSWLPLSAALIYFVVSIIPTIFPVIHTRPTISFVVVVVSPALVVLTLIFVEEVLGERSLVLQIPHLLLYDVALVIMLGPVAWDGLLLFLATRATAFVFVLTRVVHRSYMLMLNEKPGLHFPG